jgi:hypothetical protein
MIDKEMRERTIRFGERIRAEDGVSQDAEVLEPG